MVHVDIGIQNKKIVNETATLSSRIYWTLFVNIARTRRRCVGGSEAIDAKMLLQSRSVASADLTSCVFE